MARITIEDCTEKVKDRFMLVALASQRAKDINSGSKITISNDKEKTEKPTVIALREIASGNVSVNALKAELLRRLQTRNKIDPIDDDGADLVVENNAENFDYIPGGTDVYVNEDYSDLDNEMFGDSNVEEIEEQ